MLFLFSPLFMSCANNKSIDSATKLITYETVPQSEQTCLAEGGEWLVFHKGDFHFCSIETADYKRECTDNSECQGSCEPKNNNAESGSVASGQCSFHVIYPGGCPKYIVNGKVVVEPCIWVHLTNACSSTIYKLSVLRCRFAPFYRKTASL